MSAPVVDFGKFTFEESQYKRGEKVWMATTLLRAVENQGLKTFDYPLAAFNLLNMGFRVENTDDFIWQMKRTLAADYNYPVILDDYGQVADGFHRICHAILDGKTTIKAYRLLSMPSYDFLEPEKKD